MRSATPLFLAGLLTAQIVIVPANALADPGASESPRAENPFREGTERVPLTPAERELLLEYTANSLNKLTRALDRAARQSEEEAYSTYVTAIIDVVIHSYRYNGRDELLMRVALNQGLALVYGVPSSDGKRVEVPAVLVRAQLQKEALFNRILKDTIELALKYLKQDQAGIEEGELSRLPYFEFALERLRKLRVWLPSVFEQEMQYALMLAGLEQFQAAVNHVTHQERLMHAQAMVGIDTLLKEYPRDVRPSEILANPAKVRQLRVDFFEVVRELLAKWEQEQRVEHERAERERAERERVERERLEEARRERLERERVERQRREQERVERESVERLKAMLTKGHFAVVKPGIFSMGSPEYERGREDREQLHQVTLTQGFEIQTTEVTQALWFEVMGTNPSYFREEKHCSSQHRIINGVPLCPNHPVERVSCEDVSDFIRALNSKTNDGYTYRLPTEAEWEYAARAGTSTPHFYGYGPETGEFAWFYDNSARQTHAVAQKKPNSWGLYDMSGNVWEMVSDGYKSYGKEAQIDPQVSPGYSLQILRGGNWDSDEWNLRSAKRYTGDREAATSHVGFRLVRTRRQ